MPARPTLILITGQPGSGKSTLAEALSEQLHLPVLSRDKLKVAYIQEQGAFHEELPDANAHVSQRFFDEIAHAISVGQSLIIEAAFQHHVWAPHVQAWSKDADITLILCQTDEETARARYEARSASDPSWERIHGSGGFPASYQPPQLDLPTITVDTTHGYSPLLDALVQQLT